jgi:hypothetical protein
MSHSPEEGDFEEDLCPLCLEELDITDKNFKPCTCGYQVSKKLLRIFFLTKIQ